MAEHCLAGPKLCLTLASVFGLGVAAPFAHAQWTVSNLAPASSTESQGYAASGGLQAGFSDVNDQRQAILWDGSANSPVNLNPLGSMQSHAYAAFNGQQGGYALVGGTYRASLWTSTAASWVDLHPADAGQSFVIAMDAGVQVGYIRDGFDYRATLWRGSAASRVNLHPPIPEWISSYAQAVDGAQQAGYALMFTPPEAVVRPVAILWNGTANSWVRLDPPGATSSYVNAASGGRQVGTVFVNSKDRASLWSGTAASWVDLSPPGTRMSYALAISGDIIAGWSIASSSSARAHAGIWTGTASSWVDLHAFLPAEFVESVARGVYTDGATITVTGYGFNELTGRNEALAWTRSACQAASVSTQPAVSQTRCASGTAMFSVVPAGTGPFSYSWRKGGAPIAPSSNPSAATSQLALNNLTPADADIYDVIVTNACSSTTSIPSTLKVCQADFDCSGQRDVDDIFIFLNAWFRLDPRCDIDGLAGVNIDDIFIFLNIWFAGC